MALTEYIVDVFTIETNTHCIHDETPETAARECELRDADCDNVVKVIGSTVYKVDEYGGPAYSTMEGTATVTLSVETWEALAVFARIHSGDIREFSIMEEQIKRCDLVDDALIKIYKTIGQHDD